jgi:hypothetical protein
LDHDAIFVGMGEGGGDRDVLADWEAEDGCRSWEGEAVAMDMLDIGSYAAWLMYSVQGND